MRRNTRHSIINLAAIFLLLIAVASAAQGQIDAEHGLWENDTGKRRWYTHHLKRADVLTLKQKWNEVGESLKGVSHAAAGTYYQPAFMSGYFLRWSLGAGFVYVEYFDVEHPCYFSYGNVAAEGDSVRFVPQFETKESICPGDPQTPREWVVADNGRYLIPVKEVARFGNFYAGFGEFNGFLRKESEGNPFAERWDASFKYRPGPILPIEYRRFVKKPITGQVIGVGKKRIVKSDGYFSPFEKRVSKTPVTINVGRLHGVRRKQEFVLLTSDETRFQTLEVTSVAERRSTGFVVRYIDDDGKEGYPDFEDKSGKYPTKPFAPVKIGLNITTSPVAH